MTKFIILLFGCTLAVAASTQAEQQQDPKKKQKSKPVQTPQQHAQAPHQHPQAPQQHAQAPHQHAQTPQEHVAKQQHPGTHAHVEVPQTQYGPHPNHARIQDTNVTNQHHAPYSVRPNRLATVHPNNATVQKVHPQHTNFHARPTTNVATVQFNQNYRIRGSENWQGGQYAAFRSYHPEWHDRGWWHTHHHHIVLIGGGWYFWNAGYWYPAWGYDPGAAYYPYDGPIYTGAVARPFDQVVADVQSILQEQGYYQGEVDGLLGPMTQDALAAYQQAQGLVATAAIDEPTLDALGLS